METKNFHWQHHLQSPLSTQSCAGSWVSPAAVQPSGLTPASVPLQACLPSAAQAFFSGFSQLSIADWSLLPCWFFRQVTELTEVNEHINQLSTSQPFRGSIHCSLPNSLSSLFSSSFTLSGQILFETQTTTQCNLGFWFLKQSDLEYVVGSFLFFSSKKKRL